MAHASLRLFLLSAACLVATGCNHLPGKPGPEPDVPRPESVLDFKTLYGQNCAACHGVAGVNGAAIALSNPVYLANISDADLKGIITKGVHGKLMPAFGASGGGLLTDAQVDVLVHGVKQTWSKPGVLGGLTPPPYHATSTGNAADGEKVFAASCASCHGTDGQGVKTQPLAKGAMAGSIVDPTYLALVSDQYLRSVVIAGMPAQGMPDWRGVAGAKPMSNEDVTAVVAWLTSHRTVSAEAQQTMQPQAMKAQPKQSETVQEPR